MQKRIIIKNGKKYIVNAPGYNDDVGPGAPQGVLWMVSTDGNWYEVTMTGTSGSVFQSASLSVNQTPLTWASNDLGYQLLLCSQDNNIYQVYLSGSAGNVTMSIGQVPSGSALPNGGDYKPYLLMQSTTDGYFYPVYANSGSVYLFVDQNGKTWMDPQTSPPTIRERGGSLQFGGTNRFLSISGSTDFVLGTGSYTVEWFQKQVKVNNFDRVFTQRVWPNANLGVSIEGSGTGNLYLWSAGVDQNSVVVPNASSVPAPRLGVWDHFAITRESGSYIQVFRNGTALRTITSSTYITSNVSSSVQFIIGGEGDNTATTMFSGSIASFRLVKGYSLYSQSYTVPTEPLRPVLGTVLLLDAMTSATKWNDLSGLNKNVTGNSVSWSAEYPTQFA